MAPPRRWLSALEWRVFIVAAVSLFPVAILSGLLLVGSAREEEERLYRGSEDTVFALLGAVDAELKSSIAALDALSVSPRLARGDFAGLRNEALDLLVRRPDWLNIVVSDSQRQLMNARLPEDTELPPIAAPESVARTLATNQPLIGGVMYAPAVKAYAFAVQVPYRSPAGKGYVLTAVIRTESLLELFDLANLSKRGLVSILDDKDVVVMRTLRHADAVGKPPSAELMKLIHRSGDHGRGITHTLENVPVYTVYRRSSYSGWAAALGIPQSSIDGPLRRSSLILGGAIALSVLLGLAAAAFVGRTIIRPMRELEASAASLGRGEATSRPTTRLVEVQRVAKALEGAHAEREAAFQGEREARLAAESANKAKDEFLAMLGHELRNPLAAITNASQVLDRGGAAFSPPVAAAAAIIGRQARHLARLTDDLLDAGRVILGKIQLSRAPVNLARVAANVLDVLRNTGRLASHSIETSLEEAWVFADATRMDQICSNLIVNALKYTPGSGAIHVTTRREGADCVLLVRDSGIGIEPALLTRVFELFVQGERALDRAQGGLGIGLTLVKRLAELHGGSVGAFSEGAGRGATFTVRLPACEAPSMSQQGSAPAPVIRGRHVALIEDNEDARASLRILLELDGHRVYEAADGPAGVELIASTPQIDVALIDIGLPELDGYEVARRLRAVRGASIRLIAASGYGAEQDIARGLAAGFDAYVIKPVEPDVLRRELE